MIEEIKKYDKNFNEDLFLSNTDHIFIMILDAIMDKNITNVKHYITENVFTSLNNLVTTYINNNKTRLFDEMNIKSTKIINYNIDNNMINIEVLLTSRYMDYFIDENGKYIEGINDHRIEKNYHIILSKNINAEKLKEARTCQNCGATLDINASGICPFCKKIIDLKNKEYIISKIDTI